MTKVPIHIICARPGWLAVDKPWGISVHNDPGRDLVSTIGDQLASDHALAARIKFSPTAKVHPVHRLDKETSGVILLAFDLKILARLSEQFANNRVKKMYTALVHGTVEPDPVSPGFSTWTYALTKKAGGRTNPGGQGKKVACETRYQIIRQSAHYSLLEIELVTGRKHQIRRHAKLAGHPVTGDTRYGSKRSLSYLKNKCGFHRMGLHCRSMELVIPGEKKPMHIQSEDSQTDMIHLLDTDT